MPLPHKIGGGGAIGVRRITLGQPISRFSNGAYPKLIAICEHNEGTLVVNIGRVPSVCCNHYHYHKGTRAAAGGSQLAKLHAKLVMQTRLHARCRKGYVLHAQAQQTNSTYRRSRSMRVSS